MSCPAEEKILFDAVKRESMLMGCRGFGQDATYTFRIDHEGTVQPHKWG
jgi:hypothetical protein